MDDIIDVNTLFGPLPQASNDLTVESLLELMRRNGVGRPAPSPRSACCSTPLTGTR